MSAAKLRADLDGFLVNFDRRVLLTNLLEEYELPYAEVNGIVGDYIEQQEKRGTQYEKSYLVHGREADKARETFAIAQGEAEMKEWLRKLQNAETALYSVEVSGGAKSMPEELQPLRRCAVHMKSLKVRETAARPVPATPAVEVVRQVKSEPKTPQVKNPVKPLDPPPKEEKPPATKATPQSKKTSPEDKKAKGKGGIGNFFGPSTPAPKKEAKAAVKPPTPKNMQDFFKKKDGPQSSAKKVEPEADKSMQLFDDDEEAEKPEASSDEEDKLAVLRKDIITVASDEEPAKEEEDAEGEEEEEEDMQPKKKATSKRRRIVDSDDDEPQVKHEKKEEPASLNTTQSETYVDEEGFLITVKSKKATTAKGSSPKPTASSAKPASEKPEKSSGASAVPPAAKGKASSSKTKQGNIMSFFSKK